MFPRTLIPGTHELTHASWVDDWKDDLLDSLPLFGQGSAKQNVQRSFGYVFSDYFDFENEQKLMDSKKPQELEDFTKNRFKELTEASKDDFDKHLRTKEMKSYVTRVFEHSIDIEFQDFRNNPYPYAESKWSEFFHHLLLLQRSWGECKSDNDYLICYWASDCLIQQGRTLFNHPPLVPPNDTPPNPNLSKDRWILCRFQDVCHQVSNCCTRMLPDPQQRNRVFRNSKLLSLWLPYFRNRKFSFQTNGYE